MEAPPWVIKLCEHPNPRTPIANDFATWLIICDHAGPDMTDDLVCTACAITFAQHCLALEPGEQEGHRRPGGEPGQQEAGATPPADDGPYQSRA
jgi:hypothetical protein